MHTIPQFLAAYDQEDSYFLPIESILCTMPSDSILVDGESADSTDQLIAGALDEIVFGPETTYDSAPGFTIASSPESKVFRITYPLEMVSSRPLYLLTDSYTPA